MELIKLDAQNRQNAELRASFNALTRKVFGFEFWFRNGCWGDDYLPYSLVENGAVLANVSVNRMNLLWNGKKYRAVQLGTVMTDPEWRGKGLLRRVMEEVLTQWRGKADFIYLFANDTVLDFYPKFGFQRLTEHQCIVKPQQFSRGGEIRRLDPARPEDEKILRRLAENHVPVSPVLSMEKNANLQLFYGLGFLRGGLYYWPERDMLAVLDDDGGSRTIADLLCSREFDTAEAISAFAGEESETTLGFSPDPSCGLPVRYVPLGDDDFLFMMPAQGDFTKTMFPVLSHA